ncbi:unnamed protein product, partial [Rotaria sp. Silwood2]
ELRYLLNGTIRDKLTEDYQRSTLKTAMQCLTGAVGANNVSADFFLSDKQSSVGRSVKSFAVIVSIQEHLQHAWLSSPGFAFYGIQRELLIASLGIALLVLFLTSEYSFIAFYELITITFAIAMSVAIFAALERELGIIETIIIIMSVSLPVVHFGVEIKTCRLLYKEHQIEREIRVTESVSCAGSAVFMAAFTTFAAEFSMTLSSLTSFR